MFASGDIKRAANRSGGPQKQKRGAHCPSIGNY